MTSKINCSHTELLDIDSPKIVPHPKNMNNHPREQIDRLAKLIESGKITFRGQASKRRLCLDVRRKNVDVILLLD